MGPEIYLADRPEDYKRNSNELVDRHYNSRYQRDEAGMRTYNTTESISETALLEEVRSLRIEVKIGRAHV